MKFGKIEHPEMVDFTLPNDRRDTLAPLSVYPAGEPLRLHIGCAKWNRQELKNFYPRGIRDELSYYSTQFNSIELNATFYRIFKPEQYLNWYELTPPGFRFFPKVVQHVSHLRRLNGQAYGVLDNFLEHNALFGDKLGTTFLQLHPNFGPGNWERVRRFAEYWPREMALAIEFRHGAWFSDQVLAGELFHLLEEYSIGNILVDTAGRRDLLHMRLTNNEAFIRFVGANHPLDYLRLDAWVLRLTEWYRQGLRNIRFFIHQNTEESSPLLASYIIEKLNTALELDLPVPQTQKSQTA